MVGCRKNRSYGCTTSAGSVWNQTASCQPFLLLPAKQLFSPAFQICVSLPRRHLDASFWSPCLWQVSFLASQSPANPGRSFVYYFSPRHVDGVWCSQRFRVLLGSFCSFFVAKLSWAAAVIVTSQVSGSSCLSWIANTETLRAKAG